MTNKGRAKGKKAKAETDAESQVTWEVQRNLQDPLWQVVEPYYQVALQKQQAQQQAELKKQQAQQQAELRQVQAQHQAQLQAQVLRVADKRFAPVPLDVRKRIRAASPAILNKWLFELLDATSLGEVFGDERANEGGDAGELVPPPHTASTDTNGTIHPLARGVLMVTELRFGPVNAELRQHIVTANDAALVDWLDRLAVAQDLEAVFGAGQVLDASREENAGSEAA